MLIRFLFIHYSINSVLLKKTKTNPKSPKGESVRILGHYLKKGDGAEERQQQQTGN